MARPRVVDEGDDLQTWTIAAKILNKKPRSNNIGCSCSLGVGREANNPSTPLRKRRACYEKLHKVSGLVGPRIRDNGVEFLDQLSDYSFLNKILLYDIVIVSLRGAYPEVSGLAAWSKNCKW
jgi:hypothetical protein